MKQTVTLNVNGTAYTTEVEPRQTLLEVVRDHLGLTGSKEGCGTGDCGACTMIVDGRGISSCLTLAVEADGWQITTIEGIGSVANPHPLQAKFIEHGAVQCGYCIPGMILAAKALLDRNPHPRREEIQRAVSGNLCRCGTYPHVFDAVERAAGIRRAENGKRETEISPEILAESRAPSP